MTNRKKTCCIWLHNNLPGYLKCGIKSYFFKTAASLPLQSCNSGKISSVSLLSFFPSFVAACNFYIFLFFILKFPIMFFAWDEHYKNKHHTTSNYKNNIKYTHEHNHRTIQNKIGWAHLFYYKRRAYWYFEKCFIILFLSVQTTYW